MCTHRALKTLLSILAIIVLAACGKAVEQVVKVGTDKAVEVAVEKAIESGASQDGQKVDVDIKGDDGSFTMKIGGKEGSGSLVVGEGAKLPDDFPKDVTVYPGMKVEMAQSMGTAFTVSAKSPDTVDKIQQYIKADMTKGGWAEQMSMSQNEGGTQSHIFTYKKETRMANIIIGSETEGGCVISYSLMQE